MFGKKKKKGENIYGSAYNRYIASLTCGRHVDKDGRRGKKLSRSDRDYMNGFVDGHGGRAFESGRNSKHTKGKN